MSEHTGISERNPFLSIIFILLTAVLGFVIIGPIIGFFLAIPFYDGNIIDLPAKLTNPTAYPEIKTVFFILQGSASLIGLVLIPVIYLYSIERKNVMDFFTNKKISPVIMVVTALMVISFMVTNSVFIDWNYHVKFPEFLNDFEAWARERETLAEEITKFFTTFNSTGEFIVGLIVIAVFPAIGEELVFRGMLQPELYRATKNQHVAIWISAFIFSAFHVQFFGFVPRMLLGALFGYLYVWSGSLSVSMIGHFVNNGFSVVMMYLNQQGIVTMDMETPEAAPWPIVVSFTIVFIALGYYFKKQFKPSNTPLA